MDNFVGAGPCACPKRSGQPQGVAPTQRANGRSPLLTIFAVALGVLLSISALGQLPSCPGPALPEKPGAELSLETRFFSELARLDGVLADGQVLQGCILSERFQFEIETGRGLQTWEAAAGEVVGYLPVLGETPRVLMRVDGEFELRAGRLRSPLTMRLLLGEPVEVRVEPVGIEFFLLRGVYQQLPLPVQARVLSRVIVAFQQSRQQRELIATASGGVFSAEVLTEEFGVRLASGEVRRLPRGQLRALVVLATGDGGVRARLELKIGSTLEGVLLLAHLAVRMLGREVQLPMREVREVVFREETLRFGGGGQSPQPVFCPSEPC